MQRYQDVISFERVSFVSSLDYEFSISVIHKLSTSKKFLQLFLYYIPTSEVTFMPYIFVKVEIRGHAFVKCFIRNFNDYTS
ncbi:hypothetical protein psyc5s11_43000 [Clostridium gelidum]|uniref:Uncharacterized protein n=1 Tax=Clostridium gelidum TaxID=704125 RepID=A0ABM7T8D1_9CLOT|nr:hypothetical protein psyc5s11_43000 [Clostridium gelidum]